MLVGIVEVRTFTHDAGLGLDGDLCPPARGQLQSVGEASLATMHFVAVHRGVIEEVDAGISSGADEAADVVVRCVGDPHQAQNDVGRRDVAESDCLHEVSPAIVKMSVGGGGTRTWALSDLQHSSPGSVSCHGRAMFM